ncbi:alkaline ceramidase 2-like [Clavelina lepadiformis]|uniref:Alkaline ceramidase n=1 Tax=Clavelina lepadiformis TaxID=159417 RepID=A0ABP0EX38_CLALP
MGQSLWKDFMPLSSQVDWCENNYEIIPIVAEFWNTISNSIFFIIPPILIYLFKQYARQVCGLVNLVWSLLIIVGAGSVYFHSTLSLVGQLMDEIAILWVCLAALGAWLPNKYLPLSLRDDRRKYQLIIAGVAVVSSFLALIKPEFNHGLLFMFGVPAISLLVLELKKCNCPRVVHVGTMSAVWWVVAVFCWVTDRFLCHVTHFPYLHSAWHIMVCLASYMACVCYAYFYASYEVPEQCPRLRFWPHDRHTWFGIPYVSLMVTAVKPRKNL